MWKYFELKIMTPSKNSLCTLPRPLRLAGCFVAFDDFSGSLSSVDLVSWDLMSMTCFEC